MDAREGLEGERMGLSFLETCNRATAAGLSFTRLALSLNAPFRWEAGRRTAANESGMPHHLQILDREY